VNADFSFFEGLRKQIANVVLAKSPLLRFLALSLRRPAGVLV
jgi:hypothetical protein